MKCKLGCQELEAGVDPREVVMWEAPPVKQGRERKAGAEPGGGVAHFYPSPREAEASGSLSSSPARTITYRNPVSKKQQQITSTGL